MLSSNSYNSEHERGGGVLLLERQQQNSQYDALALFQNLFSSIVLNGFCPPLQEEENLNRDDKEKQKAAEEGRQLTNSFVNNPTRSIVDDRQESKVHPRCSTPRQQQMIGPTALAIAVIGIATRIDIANVTWIDYRSPND